MQSEHAVGAWYREKTAIIWPLLIHPSVCRVPVCGEMQQQISAGF